MTGGIVRHELHPGAGLWPELQPVWRELLAETGEPSAFLSETWIETWLETFGERMRTSGMVWRDEGGKAAGCALLSRGPGRFGPVAVSRSFLNASGASEVGCDHDDVLAVASHRSAVLDDLVDELVARGDDELALRGARARLFEEILERWPSNGWNGHDSESPYVDLDVIRASGQAYLQSLSSNSRSKIRRSIRLYEEQSGEAIVEVAGTTDEALAWLGELVELHESTWQERGEAGAFRGEALAFHRAIIRKAVGRTGLADLRVDVVRVRFGTETIGLLYNFVHQGRVNFYQSGLQYADDRKFKPGLVAHALAIEHYLERGESEYDFLGGEAQPVQYKRSLSTQKRSLYWAQLHAPTLKMRGLGATRQAWRRLKALRGTALEPDR